jgi:hypothetical protein
MVWQTAIRYADSHAWLTHEGLRARGLVKLTRAKASPLLLQAHFLVEIVQAQTIDPPSTNQLRFYQAVAP